MCLGRYVCFFFCKQKTAYEVRISDWSSDVCSSDLFKDRMGYPAKLYDDLRLPDRKPLSRPQIERDVLPAPIVDEIGRASCRERVCQYVWISVVAVSFKKKALNRRKETDIDNRIKKNVDIVLEDKPKQKTNI